MRRFQTGALALAAILVLASCQPPPTVPDIIVNAGNNNGNISNPGGPGATPSPGAPGATCGTVATVRVGFFGIGCPSGVAPRNGEGVLPMGCMGFETATPKNAQGTDVPASVHGPLIAWAAPTGSERVRLVAVEEPFNQNVVPVSVGDVVVSATNTPPSCSPVTGTHSFQVVAASARSGDSAAAAALQHGDEVVVYDMHGRARGTYRLGDPWPTWLRQLEVEARGDGLPFPLPDPTPTPEPRRLP
ncbi:MAG TPA: hypothetical protein VJ735_20260 [Actinomycetes bacterium]|nr:hypothetical protein [Actinomycetes bacterium]